jgi:predicted TPR repeat methyltransferase
MNTAHNLLQEYEKAEALVSAGELRQAADMCRVLLDKHPDFPYGYYLMSSLFRATGTFNNALTFSQMAIKLLPDNPAFHVQHGQILFAMGENAGAAEAFRMAHALGPNDPIPLLLWADAMAQQGKVDDAIRLFGRAREVRDIPEIDLHEGLCRMMRGEHDAAEDLFNRVIERAPEYEWGHVQKGKLLLQRKSYANAEACFARALKCNEQAYEALHGMAMVSELQKRYDMATNYAMQAIQANPNGWESHMLLGSLLITQHQYAMAEQVLSQAHGLQPFNAFITQMYVFALIRQNKKEQALKLFEAELSQVPDNRILRYFHAMLKGDNVELAPKEYVCSLFDHYADRFDHHLVQMLQYSLPQHMLELIEALTQKRQMSLLDLGCGTGLVAEALESITTQRVGVDLSANMIAKARDRKLYNALYAQDIIEFTQQCEQCFDLVTLADVVIYMGDLTTVFASMRNVMEKDGLLILSIEKEEQEKGYHLKPTGRYTHAPSYVKTLAQDYGYDMVHEQDVAARMENDMPVSSTLYAFKKRQIH